MLQVRALPMPQLLGRIYPLDFQSTLYTDLLLVLSASHSLSSYWQLKTGAPLALI